MRQLTSSEFLASLQGALKSFASDWSRQRVQEPDLFPDVQADRLWWEAFSEFAQAEVINQGLAERRPALDAAADLPRSAKAPRSKS